MRRATKITSVLIGIGAGVAAVVWMLRDRLMGPEAMPAAPPKPPAFRVVPAVASSVADGDDLTLIKGIGPAFRARLAAAGIVRFADLAAASPAAIVEATGTTEDRAAAWIDQAHGLAG
jgi:predicted flap endonuclease-1-like 5' DNA nuclease